MTLAVASTELGFYWARSSPHNPASNGACERANQSLLHQIVRLRDDGFTLEEAVELGAEVTGFRVGDWALIPRTTGF